MATSEKKVHSSRDEYARRLNGVLDHVDAHLGDPLEIPELARVANFSPFHFHRLFSVWMGETVGDYLRRRRLNVGANMLVHRPQQSVLEIAIEVGFGSAEAFSRAFRQQFKETPSQWRMDARNLALIDRRRLPRAKVSNPDQMATGIFGDRGDSNDLELVSNVALVVLPPVRVAYLRNIGPYGPDLGRFWHELFLPWRTASGLVDAPCYGIGHDDPGITAPDKCRYDACVEISQDFMPPRPANVAVVPGGKYAVATFAGHARKVTAAWQELLRLWLPESGMQVDARPFFEYYDTPPDSSKLGGVFQCKLCVPVSPL